MARIKLETLMHIGAEIEEMVETMGIDYIEACLIYCHEHDMEIEVLGSIIQKHQALTSRIQTEAESLNYLPKDDAEKLKFDDAS